MPITGVMRNICKAGAIGNESHQRRPPVPPTARRARRDLADQRSDESCRPSRTKLCTNTQVSLPLLQPFIGSLVASAMGSITHKRDNEHVRHADA